MKGYGGRMLLVDLTRGTSMRAFEKSVLDEMADAVERGRFVTRTAPDPNPQTDGTKSGHVFCQNCETVCEAGGLNLIYHRALSRKTVNCSFSNPS